jgi:hypothetical protein
MMTVEYGYLVFKTAVILGIDEDTSAAVILTGKKMIEIILIIVVTVVAIGGWQKD